MKSRTFSPWLVRSSTIALGIALVAFGATGPVSSQSFQGHPVPGQPAAGDIYSYSASGTTTDVVLNFSSEQAVIDWTVDDTATGTSAPIQFQAAGTTTTFSRISGGDFAVLNRILPTATNRAIQLDGNIRGLVNVAGAMVPGGTIFFYSPGGLIIGPNAQIDVGALGLTTAPPDITTGFSGGFITDSSGTTSISGAARRVTYGLADPASSVVITSGAQINALIDKNSYVAVLSPFIEQDGVINVNGSTALVAGGAGTLTWNSNGLFDIQVTEGTDGQVADASGTRAGVYSNGGTTGGTTASGTSDGSDYHRVYMVSIPKNTAITTLISAGSTLGFDVAGAADVSGNAVILTAGYDYVSGATSPSFGAGTGAGNIDVGNTRVTSALNAYAIDSVGVSAFNGTSLLSSDVHLEGGIASIGSTGAGSLLRVGSDRALNTAHLDLISTRFGNANTPDASGGSAGISADQGGRLEVNGVATLDASAFAASSSGTAGNGSGGGASVTATLGGAVVIGADLILHADGHGSGDGLLGIGVGGTAQVSAVRGNSSIFVGGTLTLTADGYGGGEDTGVPGFVGGAGFGGFANLATDEANGSSNIVTINGAAVVSAIGYGGQGDGADSGNGTGGMVNVLTREGNSLVFNNNLTADATGRSGYVTSGSSIVGAATGGTAQVAIFDATGGSITVGGDLNVLAPGLYRNGHVAGASGGLTTGGNAYIAAPSGSVSVTGATFAQADATGDDSLLSTGGGSVAQGGAALISAGTSGSLAFTGGLNFSASADAGATPTSGLAGSATGGRATLTTTGDAIVTSGSDVTGFASGVGAAGIGFSGGDGFGGIVAVGQQDNSQITISGALRLDSLGQGGDTAPLGSETLFGGKGSGFSANLYALGSNTVHITGSAQVTSDGVGGLGGGVNGIGNGGDGFGGSNSMSRSDGAGGTDFGGVSIGAAGTATIRIDGNVDVTANGTGGTSINNGFGGTGTGGDATLGSNAVGASLFAGTPSGLISVIANGSGGFSSASSAGGLGTGGQAGIVANGVTTLTSSVSLFAKGGGGGSLDGDGGEGRGGRTAFFADTNGQLTMTGATLEATADGSGGGAEGSGNGGNGFTGSVDMSALGGSTITANGAVTLSALSYGGGGVVGGIADGRRDLSISPSTVQVAANGGTIILNGLLTASADATGGDGRGLGNIGGAGYGGSLFVAATNNSSHASRLQTANQNLSTQGLGGFAASLDISGTGGAGGLGTGGQIVLIGEAGNGTLVTGDIDANASGIGGTGGVARAGFVEIGTETGIATATNTGSASFGNLTLSSAASGGLGGDADVGGAGGEAFGGSLLFASRGALASAGDVDMQASAQGGGGGNGTTTPGNGGNATTGSLLISALDRGSAANRGSLSAGVVTGDASATFGAGNPGSTFFVAGPGVTLRNSDATFGSLALSMAAGGPSSLLAASPASLSLVNGTLTITNGINMSTSGAMSVFADNATLNAGPITLSAADFVQDSRGLPAVHGALSGNGISITSSNGIVIDTTLNSGAALNLNAPGAISGYDLVSTGAINVNAGGAITLRDITGASNALLTSLSSITARDVTARNVAITSPLDVLLRNLDVGDIVIRSNSGSARNVTFGNLISDKGAYVAGATLQTGSIDAGEFAVLTGTDIAVGGNVTVGIVNPYSAPDANYSVAFSGTNSISLQNVTAAKEIQVGVSAGTISTGVLTAGHNVLVLGKGAVTIGGIASAGGSGDYVYISDASIAAAFPFGNFTNPLYYTPVSPGPLSVYFPNFQTIYPTAPAALAANLTINGPITGGNIKFASSAAVTLGGITAQGLVYGRGGSISGGGVTAQGAIDIAALTGALNLNGAISGNGVTLAGSSITLGGNLQSGSLLSLTTNGSISGFDISAAGDIFANVQGPITIGNVSSDGTVDLTSTAAITTGTVAAGEDARFDSGATLTTGRIDAGDAVVAKAAGTMIVNGPVTAGVVNRSASSAARYSVALIGGTNVTAGDLTATQSVAVVAGTGQMTTGLITAGTDVLLLGHGNISVAGINAAANASNYVYIADSSMLSLVSDLDTDPSAIFTSPPTAFTGSFSSSGPITGGNIVLASANAVSLGNVTATGLTNLAGQTGLTAGNVLAGSSATLRSAGNLSVGNVTGQAANLLATGGLLSVNGIVAAPSITVFSSDIAIGQTARLNAGQTGTISLYSLSNAGTIIGDGVTGTGYLLDNAEFGRINSGFLNIFARNIQTLPVDLTIGKLDITGPLNGSTIDAPNGAVTFGTGSFSPTLPAQPSGTIRVVGAVGAKGFRDTNSLVFLANTFELDAATGSIELLGASTGLAGGIVFDTNRIHVAQASILNALEADPLYANRVADLNTPLATTRPNGVVWSGSIDTGSSIGVLVQNTGTTLLPAGFLTNSDGALDRDVAPPLGSIDVVLNGQLLTSAGLITGPAVHDRLVSDANRPFFTAGATINGCLISTIACAVVVETPPEILNADNLTVVDLVDTINEPANQQDEPQTEDERKRKAAEEEAKRLPIPPPTPLISTQPLTPRIDVDEPVAGSGNPALIGSGNFDTGVGKGNQ